MPRSGIREVMELAGTMEDVIHLEVGEPDFATPAEVISAATNAAVEGFTKYSPNAGFMSLRRAVAERLMAAGRQDVTPEHIVITPGAVCALATAIFAIVNPGEDVLVPDPGWPNYRSAVLLAGARPVAYELDRSVGYLPRKGSLTAAAGPQAKLLMTNSPANPTGAVFPRDTVRELYEFAAERDLYLLSDEVYESFVFNGRHESPAQFDGDGRVIVVSGFSKSFAMTGWRLGYAVAAPPIAQLIAKLLEPLVSCASSVVQKAGEAALRLPADRVEVMRRSYAQRAEIVVEILGSAGLLMAVPRGAFYALVDVSSAGSDSNIVARDLLRRERVATAPGATFGRQAEGTVRISLATDETTLVEGCNRIRRYLEASTRESSA
ncbi:MAG: pyridoxal phosphate-dependent aminotransferase [Candidatus Dormibacteria bacterium]